MTETWYFILCLSALIALLIGLVLFNRWMEGRQKRKMRQRMKFLNEFIPYYTMLLRCKARHMELPTKSTEYKNKAIFTFIVFLFGISMIMLHSSGNDWTLSILMLMSLGVLNLWLTLWRFKRDAKTWYRIKLCSSCDKNLPMKGSSKCKQCADEIERMLEDSAKYFESQSLSVERIGFSKGDSSE